MPRNRGWKNVVRVLKELLRETSPHGHRSTFCVSLATPEAETRLAKQVSRRHNRCQPPPHHRRLPVRQRIHRSNRTDPLSEPSSSPTFLSLGIRFFLFPIFFGLAARVIPLRSGLRVFCFHGSSPDSMGPSHKADASLRLHAPSLSLVPQRKRGRKKGKRKCPIYMLSGIASGVVCWPAA